MLGWNRWWPNPLVEYGLLSICLFIKLKTRIILLLVFLTLFIRYQFKINIINVINSDTCKIISKMPSTMFELMYHKSKNFSLFETLENANTGLHNLQNYIPLYRRFFSLSDTNHNNKNLRYHIFGGQSVASIGSLVLDNNCLR